MAKSLEFSVSEDAVISEVNQLAMRLRSLLIAIMLFSPAAGGHHGRTLLMGHTVLVFDDKKVLFHAGMTAGDFFDKLERKMTAEGERFYVNSSPITNYPESLKVNLFANDLPSAEIPGDKRCAGVAEAVMNSLDIKVEWKTGLNARPVSKLTVRQMQRNELPPVALLGYQLLISSEGVPLTDHLIVTVYGPDSTSLLARFSGAP